MAWERETYFIKLPVVGANFRVLNIDEEVIVSQILPIPEDTLSIPGRDSIATYILYFTADHIPPLGYKTYQIEKVLTQDLVIMKETQKSYMLISQMIVMSSLLVMEGRS